MRGRTKLATRGARAIAAGGALAVVASVAGVALAQAPALAGTNAGTSYEYDCTTSLQAGEVAPFEVVANLTAAPDPALNSGGPFGATGALTFPVPGSEAAGFYSYGITSTGLNVSGLVIGSPDGTATGTYTYQHDFASQAITPTTVTGVSWDGSTATLTATAGTFSADEVGDGVSSTTAGLPSNATIVAVAGDGSSATLQAATTAAGTGSVKLFAPMTFTDSSVDTDSVFTTATTVGGDANIGLLPGTSVKFALTTNLITVPFGGTTGVGASDCVQTGWDASSNPGPVQTGATTPALPPAAMGGATSLVSVTSGFTQSGTSVQITPPTAAYVVGQAPAGATITVDPRANLKNGQKVTVTGLDFPAASYGGTAFIAQCSSQTPTQAECDGGNYQTATVQSDGTFAGVTLTIDAGSAFGGQGTCSYGHTCYITATTDISGADPTQSATPVPITFEKVSTPTKVKTSTSAKASKKSVKKGQKFTISGAVKAGGKGVKGLKETLYAGKKKVASKTSGSGGKFSFKLKGAKKTTKYYVQTAAKTVGSKAYQSSKSKTVTVKHKK